MTLQSKAHEQIDEIVALRAQGKTQQAIAEELGLTQPIVSLALRNVDVPIEASSLAPSVHLVARDPQQMAMAKTNLAAWLRGKIQQCTTEARELGDAAGEAVTNGWKADTLDRHEKLAKKRVDFYTKVLAAVDAGYTIVPNFPLDLFAIRVNRKTPPPKQYTSGYSTEGAMQSAKEIQAQVLPVEEGRYVGTMPYGLKGDYEEESGGKNVTKYFFSVTDFTQIEFPIEAARTEVMSATAEAMALRVFDQIGICPQTRKGDPLIIGRILGPGKRWSRKEVSFLIAWHLDLRTL